jgi:hypothetical protein
MTYAILDQLGDRGLSVLLGLIIGGLATWLFARYKRFKERRSILSGDARDTIVIHQHLVSATDSGGQPQARTLRIRSLGQGLIHRVVPNGHLAAVLQDRAATVTPRDTLIAMDGAEGSYLLETLMNFVCDRVANEPFEHDLYVMAPCCEPAALVVHQPVTILLIAVKDLQLFAQWPACRDIEVEHGSDGIRILTLMDLARRFRREQENIARLREGGQRTRYLETMYILDLALDRRSADVPTKRVPWGRFEEVLKLLNLEGA